MFKINDRVRLKHDNKENPSLTVRSDVGGQRFLCISDCGQRMAWAGEHELELVERNFDLKQAIREVLLGDEFLAAFAGAISSKLQQASVSAEPPKQPSWTPDALAMPTTPESAGHFDDIEGIWVEEKSPFDGRRNSDTIPQGYRKLKDSSVEPRQIGDLRWSVSERRYIEISVAHLGYANRDNWAACRKVEETK